MKDRTSGMTFLAELGEHNMQIETKNLFNN